ncbi:hypothetical protein [Cycloclasticus sp.]|uniref:hypothetical protein n=1 Tax=Cycloclasticus sp. TaxID=2024830 RepID=UPI000C0E4E32|nr:hypothetical protein [Cycloclasticus sp.]PHR52104.1 MAG: hypothetical protein COA48_03250 [Cycloclasticus sp.]
MTFKKIILASIFCFTPLITHADVLLIDVINKEPANTPAGLLRPKNGQSMDTVISQFGNPIRIHPTVGEPPITRWQYVKFSVYFEHNLVIHSVVNKPKKALSKIIGKG